MLLGVSIVICCYNSAQRLPVTLAHLAAQQVKEKLLWEVIVVDNASTDTTSQVALELWPPDAPASLRVICEPELGLSHARYRGLAEAKYEIVSFVDDDNWVCPEWVQLVAEIMSDNPDVGACGGVSEAVCEIEPPEWFEEYRASFAVGDQGEEAGDVTFTRGYLWGAGLTIRKAVWLHLVNNGFRLVNEDRKGTSLSSGGDGELCFAMRLAGWRLWYEPRLRLYHFLPASRLQWSYLRRLHRGGGASSVGLEPYFWAFHPSPMTLKERLRQTWQWQTLALLKAMLFRSGKLLSLWYSGQAYDREVLLIEGQIGRLAQLLRRRKAYNLAFRELRSPSWRHTNVYYKLDLS